MGETSRARNQTTRADPALRGGRPERLHDRRSARRFTELKAEIVRLINRIEAYGCVVKNIDLGLLDFPALRDGRPIYLCWKAGESYFVALARDRRRFLQSQAAGRADKSGARRSCCWRWPAAALSGGRRRFGLDEVFS